MTALTLLALAGAIVFHALVPRYQVTHLAGVLVMRTDRWTGRMQLCRGSLTAGAFVCGGPPLPFVANPEDSSR